MAHQTGMSRQELIEHEPVLPPGASAGKALAERLLRQHCEDMARHLKSPDPERREKAVEALAAHACIRVSYTIR